jgi:hypothetical protein
VGLEAAIFNEWDEPPLSAICPINILRVRDKRLKE